MKKGFLFLALVAAFFLISACVSPPPAPPPTPPAEDPPPPPPATPQYNRHSSGIILDGAQSYTVVRRDSLAGIAWKLYEDGSYYPLILIVQDDIIKDIDKIYPNTTLTIPNLKVNLEDQQARDSLYRFMQSVAGIEDSRRRTKTAEMIRNRTR